jgi:hypothetical protein
MDRRVQRQREREASLRLTLQACRSRVRLAIAALDETASWLMSTGDYRGLTIEQAADLLGHLEQVRTVLDEPAREVTL